MGINTNPKERQLVTQGNRNKITWTNLRHGRLDL
jgi:hypothetical protein